MNSASKVECDIIRDVQEGANTGEFSVMQAARDALMVRERSDEGRV
jgi:hypothetical protein